MGTTGIRRRAVPLEFPPSAISIKRAEKINGVSERASDTVYLKHKYIANFNGDV